MINTLISVFLAGSKHRRAASVASLLSASVFWNSAEMHTVQLEVILSFLSFIQM